MKTLQELYDEVVGDDGKKGAFVEALRAGNVADSLAGHDCSASEEDVRGFLEDRSGEKGSADMSAQELEEMAGGLTTLLPHGSERCTDETEGCSDTCIRDCC